MKRVIKLTESDLTRIVKQVIDENYATQLNMGGFPKLKDLKPYGLKYSVKSLKNLLVKKLKPGGRFSDNKWDREHMPFPPELDILNAIFQSNIAQFYFKKHAESKGKSHYDWATLITKEALDDFPLPPNVFNSVVDILTKDK